MSITDAIGVFDSGVGGVSTLRVLAQELPHENFIFYGDSKHAPYGDKSADEVYALSKQNVTALLSQGVKAVVIACNTATSAAKPRLVKDYPQLPILGIEPALKAAVDHQHQNILVLGTGLTLHLPKYQAQVARFAEQVTIQSVACPGLADLVEKGAADLPAIKAYLAQQLAPYRKNQFDAVVLGCTHYPFITQEILASLQTQATIYTGYHGLAQNLKVHLQQQELLRTTNDQQTIRFMSSRNTPKELALYRQLFAHGIDDSLVNNQ